MSMSRGEVARRVRERKKSKPEEYCPHSGCLWHTKDGSYCPRHQPQVLRDLVAGKHT
jgi:hypothetical protein